MRCRRTDGFALVAVLWILVVVGVVGVTFQVGALSAAGVAGWVVATFGLGGVLMFDAVTYFFSAFCISRVRYTPADHITEKEHESFFHTLRAGLRYLGERRGGAEKEQAWLTRSCPKSGDASWSSP